MRRVKRPASHAAASPTAARATATAMTNGSCRSTPVPTLPSVIARPRRARRPRPTTSPARPSAATVPGCRSPPRSACGPRVPGRSSRGRACRSRAGSAWVSRMPSVVMIVTKSMGVSSMIRSAIGCSAAVAAASEPLVTASSTSGISAIVAGDGQRDRLGLRPLRRLRLEGEQDGQQGGDDHDRTEESEEHAGCRARSACTQPYASSRSMRRDQYDHNRGHPASVAQSNRRTGRDSGDPEQRSFEPIGGEDGSDPQNPIVQAPRLQLAARQDVLGQAHLAVHRGDHRGRARRDDRPASGPRSESRSSRSARASSPSSR